MGAGLVLGLKLSMVGSVRAKAAVVVEWAHSRAGVPGSVVNLGGRGSDMAVVVFVVVEGKLVVKRVEVVVVERNGGEERWGIGLGWRRDYMAVAWWALTSSFRLRSLRVVTSETHCKALEVTAPFQVAG